MSDDNHFHSHPTEEELENWDGDAYAYFDLKAECDRLASQIAEIDDALGNGAREDLWPPGLTRAQAIVRLTSVSYTYTCRDGHQETETFDTPDVGDAYAEMRFRAEKAEYDRDRYREALEKIKDVDMGWGHIAEKALCGED